MKILVVDDDEQIRNVIMEYLKINDFECEEAQDGFIALSKLQKNRYDLVVLDIMMPKLDGYYVAKKAKEQDKDIPIILLSAKSEEYDKLYGFELGIDDYITKPFSPKELIARIHVILKRRGNNTIFKYKTLECDKEARKVTIDGGEIKLSPKEYDLLFYFIENKGIALSREKLLSAVWGYEFFGDDRTIDTHVKTLRNNLNDYRDLIKTMRSVGYKFDEEE